MSDHVAEVGVIGGSGLYELLDDVTEYPMSTPYGPPSDPVVVGTVPTGRRAPRGPGVGAAPGRPGGGAAPPPGRGPPPGPPPHRIPYRANLWALRSLGVRQVLAPCAVGGLRPELGPGTFVLPDQLVDRT